MNKETKEKLEELGFLITPGENASTNILSRADEQEKIVVNDMDYNNSSLPQKNAYLMALEYEAKKMEDTLAIRVSLRLASALSMFFGAIVLMMVLGF